MNKIKICEKFHSVAINDSLPGPDKCSVCGSRFAYTVDTETMMHIIKRNTLTERGKMIPQYANLEYKYSPSTQEILALIINIYHKYVAKGCNKWFTMSLFIDEAIKNDTIKIEHGSIQFWDRMFFVIDEIAKKYVTPSLASDFEIMYEADRILK